MKNTLENEMLDAAISWCDSNGINVLEPEQLASLVNSLYITVRDAAPANLVLVPLRPTRAMEGIFQQDDWQWADVLAAAESVTEEQYLFALEDDEQAQPERAPLTVDVFYLAGHDPFICGAHGKLTVAALSEIELDVQENPDFKKGDGVYSYSVTRFEGQYGFEGRCELAPGWELVEHKFTPIDAAIKQGGR